MEGVYEGDLVKGAREGRGRISWPNGDYYEGEFTAGLRQGQGIFVYGRAKAGGQRRYEGSWRRSMKHGTGIETWPNGDRYEGEYFEDKFHGQGKLVSRRTRYQGDFQEGYKDGWGNMIYSNKATYDGEFIKGRIHGYGEYVWPDGRRYTGEWDLGVKHGKGIMTEADGEKYDGEWHQGQKHGVGVKRWKNGKSRPGEWHQDRLVKWIGPEVFGLTGKETNVRAKSRGKRPGTNSASRRSGAQQSRGSRLASRPGTMSAQSRQAEVASSRPGTLASRPGTLSSSQGNSSTARKTARQNNEEKVVSFMDNSSSWESVNTRKDLASRNSRLATGK